MGNRTDDSEPDTCSHNALQHLGVGVGHELYQSLMATFAGENMKGNTKKSLVGGFQIDI